MADLAGGQANADAAQRYAAALFDLARDAGAIDATAGDMERLRAMLDESEDLRRLVESPAFSRADKQAGLVAVAERGDVSSLTRNFLGVLAGNGRAQDLAGAADAFADLVARHRGVTVAEVAAPKPLSADQVERLQDSLTRAVGARVEVRASVEPALLGGMVVKVGSRMFDSSLKTKLEGLKSAMKGA